MYVNKFIYADIQEAIEDWKEIVLKSDEYMNTYSHICPLCLGGCEHCPIAEDTEAAECHNTSYYNTRVYLGNDGSLKADQAMLDYLIGLKNRCIIA